MPLTPAAEDVTRKGQRSEAITGKSLMVSLPWSASECHIPPSWYRLELSLPVPRALLALCSAASINVRAKEVHIISRNSLVHEIKLKLYARYC